MSNRVAIIGLGLIGASIGLALQTTKGKDRELEIVGYDIDGKHAGIARKRGAVDKTEGNLLRAVQDAEVVVIATPVRAIGEVLQEIGPHLREHCVVTDTGSTKVQVLAWADQYLPPTVSFVGGHPMAGKEASGPDAADADLFVKATYCVIPSLRADAEAIQVVVGLANTLGATPMFLDAAEHDSYVAAVSHLPLLLASALVSVTTASPSWKGEMARLASSGYRDSTRLASGDPTMGRDICATNQDYITHWIDAFVAELIDLKKLLGQPDALKERLEKIADARQRFMLGLDSGPVMPAGYKEKLPSGSEVLLGSYVGGRLARTWGQMVRQTEEKEKAQEEKEKR